LLRLPPFPPRPPFSLQPLSPLVTAPAHFKPGNAVLAKWTDGSLYDATYCFYQASTGKHVVTWSNFGGEWSALAASDIKAPAVASSRASDANDKALRLMIQHRKMLDQVSNKIANNCLGNLSIAVSSAKTLVGIRMCAEAIGSGGLAVVPTDTVYCLGCLASNDAGVARMYQVKERPKEKPISFWFSSLDVFDEADFDPAVWRFMKRLWPAPVSLVMKKGPWLRHVLPNWENTAIGNEDSIAIRIPNATAIMALLQMTGPLAITSANPSGAIDICDWIEAAAIMGPRVDHVLTDNLALEAVASTVINFKTVKCGDELEFFRIGCVAKHFLVHLWEGVCSDEKKKIVTSSALPGLK